MPSVGYRFFASMLRTARESPELLFTRLPGTSEALRTLYDHFLLQNRELPPFLPDFTSGDPLKAARAIGRLWETLEVPGNGLSPRLSECLRPDQDLSKPNLPKSAQLVFPDSDGKVLLDDLTFLRQLGLPTSASNLVINLQKCSLEDALPFLEIYGREDANLIQMADLPRVIVPDNFAMLLIRWGFSYRERMRTLFEPTYREILKINAKLESGQPLSDIDLSFLSQAGKKASDESEKRGRPRKFFPLCDSSLAFRVFEGRSRTLAGFTTLDRT